MTQCIFYNVELAYRINKAASIEKEDKSCWTVFHSTLCLENIVCFARSLVSIMITPRDVANKSAAMLFRKTAFTR